MLYGFDDGELKEYLFLELEEMLGEGSLETLEGDRSDGMVANERGFAAAAGFSFVKGYPDDRAVGVFIGKLFIEMCTADVYLEHQSCICLERFATERARRRSSGDGISQQARLGLHTMRAGDRVTYNHLEDGESYETAWVMAVVYKPKSLRASRRANSSSSSSHHRLNSFYRDATVGNAWRNLIQPWIQTSLSSIVPR